MKNQNYIIDSECKLPNVELVCHPKTQKPYSCTLCFASVQNNSNKFYIIQYLKQMCTTDVSTKYHIFVKYGRVGEKGKTSIKTFEEKDKYKATALFQKKFFTQTGNQWDSIVKPENFKSKPNKYDLVEFEDILIEQEETIGTNLNGQDVTLSSQVTDFIHEISDKNLHMTTISSFNVDMNKLPLGKISSKQIEKAQGILSKLNDIISDECDTELDKGSDLLSLSDQFWRIVPYSCGRNRPPIIKTKSQIQHFADLLEVIQNTEIAGKITRRFNNIFDIYTHMGITMSLVDNEDEKDMLSRQIYGTHAPTHNYGIKILECLRVSKNIPETHNEYFKNIPNHKLLMHGSRKANFMGILSSGLRLPLPGQVSNGSVLGKGIYFADVSTKSFNYCGIIGIDIGYLLICEVALGNNSDIRESPCFDNKLAADQTSRIALGKSYLHDNTFKTYSTEDKYLENVQISNGPLSARENSKSSFLYNEYVIFDTRQYQFRYIVKIQKT